MKNIQMSPNNKSTILRNKAYCLSIKYKDSMENTDNKRIMQNDY